MYTRTDTCSNTGNQTYIRIAKSTKHHETYALHNNVNNIHHGMSDPSKTQKKHKHNKQWEGKSPIPQTNKVIPKANQLKHTRHELNTRVLINNITQHGQLWNETELAKLCLVVTDEKGLTILNIDPRVASLWHGTFSVILVDFRWVPCVFCHGAHVLKHRAELFELRAPMNENRKTRYFTRLPHDI